MKTRKTEKDEFVQKYVKEKARKAAEQFIEEIHVKAARDVEGRLKFFDPMSRTARDIAPATRCGRADNEPSGVQKGYGELFDKFYNRGMSALNRGDAGTAAYYFGKCLLLPVTEEKKLRKMVRENLKLAVMLKKKQQA